MDRCWSRLGWPGVSVSAAMSNLSFVHPGGPPINLAITYLVSEFDEVGDGCITCVETANFEPNRWFIPPARFHRRDLEDRIGVNGHR